MKEKILISACLVGENCRYDGKNALVKELKELTKYYDLIPICPEVSGGLKTPRFPSEIKDGKVISKNDKDVTEFYNNGAYWAKSVCLLYNVKLAILKEKSPSCGVHQIYDGTFSNNLIEGEGITTKKLKQMHVKVINEKEAVELLHKLNEEHK